MSSLSHYLQGSLQADSTSQGDTSQQIFYGLQKNALSLNREHAYSVNERKSDLKIKNSLTLRNKTPQLVRTLDSRKDPNSAKKKAEAFQVYADAFESYYEVGFVG